RRKIRWSRACHKKRVRCQQRNRCQGLLASAVAAYALRIMKDGFPTFTHHPLPQRGSDVTHTAGPGLTEIRPSLDKAWLQADNFGQLSWPIRSKFIDYPECAVAMKTSFPLAAPARQQARRRLRGYQERRLQEFRDLIFACTG